MSRQTVFPADLRLGSKKGRLRSSWANRASLGKPQSDSMLRSGGDLRFRKRE